MLPLNSTHIPFDSCPLPPRSTALCFSVTGIHCPHQSWRLEFKTKYKMCSNRSMAKEWHLCLLSAPIVCLFKLQFPCLLSHYHLAVKQCLLDLCMEVWTECLLLFFKWGSTKQPGCLHRRRGSSTTSLSTCKAVISQTNCPAHKSPCFLPRGYHLPVFCFFFLISSGAELHL